MIVNYNLKQYCNIISQSFATMQRMQKFEQYNVLTSLYTRKVLFASEIALRELIICWNIMTFKM